MVNMGHNAEVLDPFRREMANDAVLQGHEFGSEEVYCNNSGTTAQELQTNMHLHYGFVGWAVLWHTVPQKLLSS